MSRVETFIQRNDVTGDLLMSRPASDTYRNNYDAIFRKPKQEKIDLENNSAEEKPAE